MAPPLDFPPGTLGATYTGPNGVIWQYDGAKWLAGTSANVYAPITDPVFLGNPQAPQPAAGDADATIPTTKFVSDAVATSLHDVGRNYLHNSMFNVAQRGVGPFTTPVYTLDRWLVSNANDVFSFSRGAMTDVYRTSIGDEAAAFHLANTFTGNAAAGSYHIVYQPVEDIRRLAGKTVTVSFWAVGSSAGLKLGANFYQDFGTGGSPSASAWLPTGQAVTLATAFARYSLTFSIPSVSGMTLGTNGNHNTRLAFWYSCGTTLAALSGNVGVQSGSVFIWGVQLELGPTATPLEKLDPVTQLQQCQRFYQGPILFHYGGYNTAGALFSSTFPFPVPMRATPVVTPTYNTQSNCGSTTIGITASFYNPATVVTATGNITLDGTFTASADL